MRRYCSCGKEIFKECRRYGWLNIVLHDVKVYQGKLRSSCYRFLFRGISQKNIKEIYLHSKFTFFYIHSLIVIHSLRAKQCFPGIVLYGRRHCWGDIVSIELYVSSASSSWHPRYVVLSFLLSIVIMFAHSPNEKIARSMYLTKTTKLMETNHHARILPGVDIILS